MSTELQDQIWKGLDRIFGYDMRMLLRQRSSANSTTIPKTVGTTLDTFLYQFVERLNQAKGAFNRGIDDIFMPARDLKASVGSYKWCFGDAVNNILPDNVSHLESWKPNLMKEVIFRYGRENAFVVVNVFCTDKNAWDGLSGVNVASSVVCIGRCIIRLVWDLLLLEEKGAVKLAPHKRQVISTTGFNKVIHWCNTLRDATVIGLWSELAEAYENATYMYLGGGTEHHPPYVYSLVFRDVSFKIAYAIAAIVLALSKGSVNKDFFYSVHETTSMQPKEDSDFEAERQAHTEKVQTLMDKLDIDGLMLAASSASGLAPSSASGRYNEVFDFEDLPDF